jgi:hypothetical protein
MNNKPMDRMDRQAFKTEMMKKFFGTGRTLGGNPVTEADIDIFVDRNWKNAHTGAPELGAGPEQVMDALPLKTEYEKGSERERVSGLARPLQTIMELWPKYQGSGRNLPWKDVLRSPIKKGEQKYMEMETPITILGKPTATGIFSLNTAFSLGEAVWDIFRPFYETGKLLSYGAIKGDLEYGKEAPFTDPEVIKKRILDYHTGNPDTYKEYNDLMKESGLTSATMEEYNRIIQEEYPALMGLFRLGEEVKDITISGYPKGATPEEIKEQFPTLAGITEYVAGYGNMEEVKRRLRDDPFGVVSDIFSVLDPATAGLKGTSKLVNKIPGPIGKKLSAVLDEASKFGTSPSSIPILRHASKLDPARIAIRGGEFVNNAIARKWGQMWAILSRTPHTAAQEIVMGYTPRMGTIFRDKVKPHEMTNFYYDAISNVERKMKSDYASVLDEKFGHIIFDRQGQDLSFNNVYNEIEKLEKNIAKEWRFDTETALIEGTATSATPQTTILFNTDTPDSRLRKYKLDAEIVERMMDEVQQLKLDAVYAGKVDANGKPIITFKDLDDLRSLLRIQYDGSTLPSGTDWADSPVSKIYRELYTGITDSIEKGLVTRHQQVSPDTKAPSYKKDLKDPYATLSRFLQDVDATFKINPNNPFEWQVTPDVEKAWGSMYNVLKEDAHFRRLLNDEIREKAGFDLVKDMAAYTYAKAGNAAPGIATARIIDSAPSFFISLFGASPETAGVFLRSVGIPRAQIGAMVDFLKIRDMPKLRPLQQAGQIGEEVLEKEQIEKDRVRGIERPTRYKSGRLPLKEAEENLRRQLDLMKQGSN